MNNEINYFDDEIKSEEMPLANRMKPKTLDDVVGQDEILGKGTLLRRLIERDLLTSIILYGPPGTGKTSIANVIANVTGNSFLSINATIAGKKEMEDVIKAADKVRRISGKKTILFIDEIHRFSKSQQDFLLSYVEKGVIILIGATTEPPFYEVNAPLLSRSTLFELKLLKPEDIKKVVNKALNDNINGVPIPNVVLEDEAMDYLVTEVNGDCRRALNILEMAVKAFLDENSDNKTITLKNVQECLQRQNIRYDKKGQNHYDTISAFIKSMRASKPDDAAYYLAIMMEAGEDPLFIARRMVIFASEDVGLADINATTVAVNALDAVKQIGMPESKYILMNAAVYLAKTLKSRESADYLTKSIEKVNKTGIKEIPIELTNRNGHPF